MPIRHVLTDNEGAILTLVLRQQPITAYQIGKAFDASPVHTLNTSKGKLYPLIRRLHERALLDAEDVPGDQRGTKRFCCTQLGKQALRRWVLTLRDEHELLHDPFRKKLLGFELLSRSEQLEWVASAHDRLSRKLKEVENWPPETEGPLGNLVQASAKVALQARIAWLDAVRRQSQQPA
jgi:DNA-binding PadR family transcriptional regulator